MSSRVAAALPQKKRALQGRRLVVIDIENVAGGAILTNEAAVWARGQVEKLSGPTSGDQVVVGVSHIGLFQTRSAYPAARLRCRSGTDGADLALIEVLEDENLSQRFDEVVLATGDGIFSEAVSALAAAGVRVTVLGRRGHTSRRLVMAAHATSYFDEAAEHVGGVA